MNVIHGMVILLLPPSLTHTRTRTRTHTHTKNSHSSTWNSSIILSAADPHLLVWSLLVRDFEGAVVHQGVCCWRSLLSPQFGADSSNNVLHLILLIRHLPISSSTAHAFVWRVLGGRLEKHHVVGFGEADGLLLAHLALNPAGVTEVTLIPHQEPGRGISSRKQHMREGTDWIGRVRY